MKPSTAHLRYVKALCLKEWRYFRDNPEARSKKDLPTNIRLKLARSPAWCPLCDVFMDKSCDECPLDGCSVHYSWLAAQTAEERRGYAAEIVELIEGWEV